MPVTPVFGLPFEVEGDQPGITLTGGEFGTEDILAEAVEAAILGINTAIQSDLDAINLDIDEINDRFTGYVIDADGASTTSETYTGASISVPSAQNPVGTRFKITAIANLASSVAGDRADLRVRRGITTGDPLLVTMRTPDLEAAAMQVSAFTVDDPPLGDIVYGLFIARATGTGTVSMSSAAGFQGRMAVEYFDSQGV